MRKLYKLVIPYRIWMIILVVLPTFLILLLSISDLDIYQIGSFRFTLEAFNDLIRPEVIIAARNSIKFSILATLISFLIGYPVAYYLSTLKSEYKTVYLALLIVPVWSNMLLRIIAWEKLFFPISILNMFGISFDLIGTDIAIIIGMVSMYLPFMVLPIYSVLEKMDHKLIEASTDLGANRIQTFIKVIFPLSLSGVVSGTIMTLLPSMTAFALPERLGGSKILLIGNIIEDYFMKTGNINGGSLISIFLMGIILLLFLLILRFDKEGETLI